MIAKTIKITEIKLWELFVGLKFSNDLTRDRKLCFIVNRKSFVYVSNDIWKRQTNWRYERDKQSEAWKYSNPSDRQSTSFEFKVEEKLFHCQHLAAIWSELHIFYRLIIW